MNNKVGVTFMYCGVLTLSTLGFESPYVTKFVATYQRLRVLLIPKKIRLGLWGLSGAMNLCVSLLGENAVNFWKVTCPSSSILWQI
jgi:hypothetical protein